MTHEECQILCLIRLFWIGTVVSSFSGRLNDNLIDLEFQSWLRPFCVEFACSFQSCMNFLLELWLSPVVQKHATTSLVNW